MIHTQPYQRLGRLISSDECESRQREFERHDERGIGSYRQRQVMVGNGSAELEIGVNQLSGGPHE